MFEQILVPTDGSDAAVVAGETAFALARQLDASIHAIHVAETNRSESTHSVKIVDAVEDAAAEMGIDVTTAVVAAEDSIHRHIIDYAMEHEIDSVVMGSHGEKSIREHVLGSVAERTLRESPVPVVTVHEESTVPATMERILVPTDGSESANAAAELAVSMAVEVGASIDSIYVVESSIFGGENGGEILEVLEETGQRAIDDVIQLANAAGVDEIQASVLSGLPHRAIQDYIDANDVDYVFMGTHGRSGMSRYLLGSVTERVVRQATVPVVSIKSTEPAD